MFFCFKIGFFGLAFWCTFCPHSLLLSCHLMCIFVSCSNWHLYVTKKYVLLHIHRGFLLHWSVDLHYVCIALMMWHFDSLSPIMEMCRTLWHFSSRYFLKLYMKWVTFVKRTCAFVTCSAVLNWNFMYNFYEFVWRATFISDKSPNKLLLRPYEEVTQWHIS